MSLGLGALLRNKKNTTQTTQNTARPGKYQGAVHAIEDEATRKEIIENAGRFYRTKNYTRTGRRAEIARCRIVESDVPLSTLIQHIGCVDAPDGPSIAWADDKNTYSSPGFEKLPDNLKVGIELHELNHVYRSHILRAHNIRAERGERFSMKLSNILMDGMINETIRQTKKHGTNSSLGQRLDLPDSAIYLTDLLKEAFDETWEAKEALNTFDFENLYAYFSQNEKPLNGSKNPEDYKNKQKGKKQQRGQPNKNAQNQGPGSDGQTEASQKVMDHAESKGWTEDLEEPEEFDQQQCVTHRQTWEQRLAYANTVARQIDEAMGGKTAGSGSNSILRMGGKDAHPNRTNWKQYIRNIIMPVMGRRSFYDLTKPGPSYFVQRKLGKKLGLSTPISYGITNDHKVGKIVVVYDTSGSIGDEYIMPFAGVIEKIARDTQCDIEIVSADDRVQYVHTIKNSDIHELARFFKFIGAGGTDFAPAIKHADRRDVSAIVYLTDLMGPCNYRPRHVNTVLWAVPKSFRIFEAEPPSFGRLVEIEA